MTQISATNEVQAAVLVLETKLRRPTGPSQHVARPRLLEQLTEAADCRLILISAPAGYGKTALVSGWLEAQAGAYAWLSLDKHDDGLANFLKYLAASIRTAYPDALNAFLALLQAPTLLAPHRLADALLQELLTLRGPLIIALDDYHTITAPDVHAAVVRLIEHLPAHVQLVLITRSDPPMPLERLRGRHAMAEIRAADLRFSQEETLRLLQQLLGPDVTEETAAMLGETTEGWVVGLHLAALSLRGKGDAAVFACELAQHGHQAITEYLLSEVLAGLPAAQRDCLLQLALFERFCASLLDAAQPDGDQKLAGEDFVRTIRRANLFVVALDDEGTWFRYHHLFQSLLRARLDQRYTNAEIRAIHARASAWFAAQGWVDEAVVHALKAGDSAVAACLVEAQVHAALDREDWRQLEHLLGLVPVEVSDRPRLLLAHGWLHFIRWQFGGVEARVDAAEQALRKVSNAAPNANAILWGEISILRATLAALRGDGDLVVQYAETALAALRPEMQYTMGMAQFYYIWGLQVGGHYDRAVDFAHRQLDLYGWQGNALSLRLFLALGTIQFEMADLPAMQSIVAIWHKLAEQSGYGLSIAWSLFGLGWLYYQRNELDRAQAYFHRLVSMSWTAHGRAVVDGYTGLVLIALARGVLDDAWLQVAALNEFLLERGMPAWGGVVQSLEQRTALATGAEAALIWRLTTGAARATGDFWEQPALTEVRTLLAAGGPSELTQATVLLAELRACALARNSTRRLVEIDGLQALVYGAQRDEAAALATLQEAVERAAPGGALRLLVDCGPGLVAYLRKLQAAGVAPGYIAQVLAAYDETVTAPIAPTARAVSTALPTRQVTPAELFSNREIDVLKLLAQRLSDKEIATQLMLSPLTVKKHTQRLYRKLGVDNRRAAVVEAWRLGLI